MIRLIPGLIFALLLTVGFYLFTFIWITLDTLFTLLKSRQFRETITAINAKYRY